MVDSFNEEQFFRVVAFVQVVLVGGVLAKNIIKSNLFYSVATFKGSNEGLVQFLFVRLTAAALFGSVLFHLLRITPANLEFSTLVPRIVRYCSIPISLVGARIMDVAQITLGANYSISLTIRSSHQLITWGPYAYTRNPMYTGLLLCCCAIQFSCANLITVVSTVLFLYGVIAWRLEDEEKMMAQQFGDSYKQYKQRVPSILPKNPVHLLYQTKVTQQDK